MDTRTHIPYLESRWISSLRNFLRQINATILLDNPKTVPPEREGDIYIMEAAIRSKAFTPKALRIINYCRLYLHVTTLSDILTTSATKILPHMYQCQRPPWWDDTKFITIQRRPSSYQIKHQWQKLCHYLLLYQHRNVKVQHDRWMRSTSTLRPCRR